MSTTIDASRLLRAGLLDGVSVLVAAPSPAAPGVNDRPADERDSLARAVVRACGELGAQVAELDPDDPIDTRVDLLVVDAAQAFALAGSDAPDGQSRCTPRDALRACLDGAWEATRAVANAAFIEPGRGGRIVYLAPVSAPCGRASDSRPRTEPAPAAAYADAARAGLENLARTLSIEWARYGITLVTIAPGERTTRTEVAALTAYLASSAGAYFSGCLLDLRGSGAIAR